MRAWGKQLPNTAMQQDRSAAVLATRSQRLSQLARRSALFFKQIPLAVWRLLVALLLVLWLAHSLARLFRSEEHTSELQSRGHLVCRPLLEKKNSSNKG